MTDSSFATTLPFVAMGVGLLLLVLIRFRRRIRLALEDFRLSNRGLNGDLQSPDEWPGNRVEKMRGSRAPHEVWMTAIVTLLVLAAALFIILANQLYDDAQQKWAFGAVGTILGYWLKK